MPDQPFPGTRVPIFVHDMYQGRLAILTPEKSSGCNDPQR